MRITLPALIASFLLIQTIAIAGPREHDLKLVKALEQLEEERLAVQNDPDAARKLAEIRKRWDELTKSQFDYTKDESNICPVHKLAMPTREARISYGLLVISQPQPTEEMRDRLFPFALEWIRGGCVYNDDMPKTGKLFVCPQCVKAEKEWLAAHRR